MEDVCDTIEILYSPDGMDFERLSESEQAANDFSNHTYSEQERRILRHYEGAARPAKWLTKVLQGKGNGWAYQTFTITVAIRRTEAPFILIHNDVSRMDSTKDLRKRGPKSVAVRKTGVEIPHSSAKNYSKVEVMDPSVEEYCDLYVSDLKKRLDLNAEVLPPLLTTHILLNPMMGGQARIVGAGLLTQKQYDRAIYSFDLYYIICSICSLHLNRTDLSLSAL